jgi:hypothetical protein
MVRELCRTENGLGAIDQELDPILFDSQAKDDFLLTNIHTVPEPKTTR